MKEVIHDRVLIKPIPTDKIRGGIELSDSEVDKSNTGEVILVGAGVPLHNIHLNVTGEVSPEAMDKLMKVIEMIEKGRALRIKPGDMVLYGKYAGTSIMLDGEEHVIVREADVFGIL